MLDAYRAAGGNFLDTADSYSHWVPGHHGGESESIIGEWMSSRGVRSEFVVATKVGEHPEFERNRKRDADRRERLALDGWALVEVWEHDDPLSAALEIAELVSRRRRSSS